MKPRIRSRPAALGVLAALLIVAPGFVAQARATGGKGHADIGEYVNALADPGWSVSRTDMGVDWVPVRKLPVLAIGDALILGSDSHSGWPGRHIIWYQLLNGSHAGDVIYVAEHLERLLPAGRTGPCRAADRDCATGIPLHRVGLG